jgi:hypothetical protein
MSEDGHREPQPAATRVVHEAATFDAHFPSLQIYLHLKQELLLCDMRRLRYDCS